MDGFLDLQIPIWMRVTFTRLIAIGPGLVVAIFTQNDQNLSDRCVSQVDRPCALGRKGRQSISQAGSALPH